MEANHPSFKNCIIETSDNVREKMNHVTEKIIEEAIMTTDPDIIFVSSMLDAKGERIQKECVKLIMNLHLHTQFILRYYQNRVSLMQTSTSNHGHVGYSSTKNDDSDENDTYHKVLPHENCARYQAGTKQDHPVPPKAPAYLNI